MKKPYNGNLSVNSLRKRSYITKLKYLLQQFFYFCQIACQSVASLSVFPKLHHKIILIKDSQKSYLLVKRTVKAKRDGHHAKES